MKLKTKMQVFFGGTMIILLMTIETVAYFASKNMSLEYVEDNMIQSADIAAQYISSGLLNYKNITAMVGMDSKLTSDISNEEKKLYESLFEIETGRAKKQSVKEKIKGAFK